MAEQLDLTVPQTRTTYTLSSLVLNWPSQIVQVVVTGSDGVDVRADYNGATAVALMTALNSANLSVKSLYRRVLERLVADGKLPAGTVSGTPS